MFPFRRISLARCDCLPLGSFTVFGVWLKHLAYAWCPIQCSTPVKLSQETVPLDLSGRTSYLQVRLAFYPYPQVIPSYCSNNGCGPPLGISAGFTLLMDRSPGFGPTTVYKVGLFTLAFTMPPQHKLLKPKVHNDYSPVHSSIGTRSPQSYDRALSVCSQTVSGSISLSVSLIF